MRPLVTTTTMTKSKTGKGVKIGIMALLFSLLAGTAALAFGAVEAGQAYAVPYLGNRNMVWIFAQLHLNLGAFILGAPMFVVLAEWLGARNKNPIFAERYMRLAKEVTKVMLVGYSFTALSGGALALLLYGLYPDVMAHIGSKYSTLLYVVYPLLFILETFLLYVYWYTWDSLKDRVAIHILIGVLLNVVGITLMFGINSVASYMLTPVKDVTAGFWDIFFNFTMWPLNLHRLIANITFGGFVVGLIAAIMYLTSKKEEDRAFYDWMGFVGNLIGAAAFMFLPMAGYLYAYEVYQYDASLGVYMMSDRLSMFFETQGMLVGALFIAANLYIWMSIKRIEGAQQFEPYLKAGFIILLVCSAIWLTPRSFMATMLPEPDFVGNVADFELPGHLGFMALMPMKKTAAFLSIAVILMSYLLYHRALKGATIQWGRINPASQYVLIFLGFTAIYTMGLMGAVREMARKFWHVYLVLRDNTVDAFTPTLASASLMIAFNTLLFFGLIGFMIWIGLKVGHGKGTWRPTQDVSTGVLAEQPTSDGSSISATRDPSIGEGER